MAKTNPIGVRFRQDVLEKLKVDHAIESPQKALVFLEMFYVSHHKLAKDVTQILKNEQESQNKPHTDTKKGNVCETIPEPEVDYSAHNAEIQKQINAVTLENKPSWLSKDKFERYQTKKIAELQLKLK